VPPVGGVVPRAAFPATASGRDRWPICANRGGGGPQCRNPGRRPLAADLWLVAQQYAGAAGGRAIGRSVAGQYRHDGFALPRPVDHGDPAGGRVDVYAGRDQEPGRSGDLLGRRSGSQPSSASRAVFGRRCRDVRAPRSRGPDDRGDRRHSDREQSVGRRVHPGRTEPRFRGHLGVALPAARHSRRRWQSLGNAAGRLGRVGRSDEVLPLRGGVLRVWDWPAPVRATATSKRCCGWSPT
jgi:hypothetical protein